MKLGIGKQYVLRNRPDVRYAVVVQKSDHRMYDYEVCYRWTHNTDKYSDPVNYMDDGFYMRSGTPSDNDLVAEFTEPTATVATDVALKFDSNKPRMDLLSVPALTATAEVLSFGAKKYASHNWRKGFEWSRLYGAALRHLTSHMNGEDLDPESGLSHLAHASCMIQFLLEHEINKLGVDDRYKK